MVLNYIVVGCPCFMPFFICFCTPDGAQCSLASFSITITLILLTNKIVASVILSRIANRKRSIVHRQRASNIDCSTVFDFAAFHNLVSANNYDLIAWFKVMP